jgi:hypothetical protein
MLYRMKCSASALYRRALASAGPILLAGFINAALAADSPLVGAWQLDSGQPAQAALYLFTPTRYSMVLAATGRPDIADMSARFGDRCSPTPEHTTSRAI